MEPVVHENHFITEEKIYLDYNATTPLDPSVLKAIHDALEDAWGNPSSTYTAGRKASHVIKEARCSVANMIGALENDIIFTSGGTEANNMVIHTALEYFSESSARKHHNPDTKPHVITSNLEHDSIQLPLRNLEKCGRIELTVVPALQDSGAVSVQSVLNEVKPNTCLVTVMTANNETGVIQPVSEIATVIRSLEKNRLTHNYPRILVHTDAAQALGKIQVDVNDLGVDYLTVVGHKFYGPRIGALYVRNPENGTPLHPMFYGGGQERNFRPGTENTGMIAGLGQASQLVVDNLHQYHEHMKMVRDHLEHKLQATFGDSVQFNGKFKSSNRIPNTCNVSFIGEGLEGRKILAAVKRLQASVGAACHSDLVSHPSPILMALGIPRDIAMNAVRLSVGRDTSTDEIEQIVEDLRTAVKSLRLN